jgi:two-component system cell cycle response regulator DivK
MSRTILVIEDNEKNRYLVTFLLQLHGHTVVQAVDGPSGIAIAATMPLDLILLDIELPHLDGYEVARRLRTLVTSSVTPIVAVTSYALAGDRERALAAGCDGYIEKPINPQTFVAEISGYGRFDRSSVTGGQP